MPKCGYPNCQNEIENGNKYCSRRCIYLNYEHKRWRDDPGFRERVRESDRDLCPTCGEKKRKRASTCRNCYKKHYTNISYTKIMTSMDNIDNKDKDSLFFGKDIDEVLDEFRIHSE